MVRRVECDVVIAGCGVAGLYCALNLPSSIRVVLLSKTDVESCDSMLAQGGICVLHDQDDYESFFEDTLKAGHYENRLESVDIMIRSSQMVIDDLVKRGVRFARKPDGELDYTREGAHSRPRIVYHEDITGEEITTQPPVLRPSSAEHDHHGEHRDDRHTGGVRPAWRRVCRGMVAGDGRLGRLEFSRAGNGHGHGRHWGLYKHSITNFPDPHGRWLSHCCGTWRAPRA